MIRHGALHVRRRRLLLALLLAAGLLMMARGFQLQVLQAAEWEGRAERQQREQVTLPAERGTLYDRNGVPLAGTREMVRVSIAPREVVDRELVASRLRSTLGVTPTRSRTSLDRSRRWVVLPGRWEPTVRSELEGLGGVYLERVLERFRPHGSLAMALLGATSSDGRALGGLELELDSLLRGEDGYAVLERDARGTPIPGALLPVRKPRAGSDVYLTIDLGLQEIAEEALGEAVKQNGATGGDLIFADPRTGEVLAAASVRMTGSRHWRGVTDPYEPGSTMKPFVLAALLDRGLVTLSDSVFAEQGHYRMGSRTISDVHGYGWLTAGEVLRYSSNIGMVKLTRRLEPSAQYAALRDFGFGTATGVGYPSESGGRLNRPDQWSGYSQASLAMGYEISVTPLQMTMAYGALANGGRLMEPRLVREVRGPGARLIRRFPPRQIRRALSPATAAAVSGALADVVEEGTGRRAGMGQFRVAGKTGTARLFENGQYRRDAYTASFAGFFPAQDPQLVFLVKLDRGRDYGGSVAAPVTRATLAAALAARATPLDRRAVAMSFRGPSTPGVDRSSTWVAPERVPYVFRPGVGVAGAPPVLSAEQVVPDVRGHSARDAAAQLHAAGFRVRLEGVGEVRRAEPVGGSMAERGSVVHLTLERSP